MDKFDEKIIGSADNRMSETRLFSSEAIKAAKMEELYRRAYKIRC